MTTYSREADRRCRCIWRTTSSYSSCTNSERRPCRPRLKSSQLRPSKKSRSLRVCEGVLCDPAVCADEPATHFSSLGLTVDGSLFSLSSRLSLVPLTNLSTLSCTTPPPGASRHLRHPSEQQPPLSSALLRRRAFPTPGPSSTTTYDMPASSTPSVSYSRRILDSIGYQQEVRDAISTTSLFTRPREPLRSQAKNYVQRMFPFTQVS